MRYSIFLLLASFLIFNSCASILHKPYVNVAINTTPDSALVIVNEVDTFCCSNLIIPIKRSKQDLNLTLKKDSLTQDVLVKREFSNLFLVGNLLTGPGFLGYLIDLRTEKRFTYPTNISVDLTKNDSLIVISKKKIKEKIQFNSHEATKKGKWYAKLTFPYVNNFLLKPEGESQKLNTGFWGSSIGMDYFYQQNKYVGFSASIATDLFIPIPAPVDRAGEYEIMNSISILIFQGHQYHRTIFGYGLSYAHNIWEFKFADQFNPPPATRATVKKSNNVVGLVFSGYRLFGKEGQYPIGIVYRPTFFRFGGPNKLQYEHLISLDLGFRINVNK